MRAGEIVGIAGVSGNGQRELADLVAGVLEPGRGGWRSPVETVTRTGAARDAGASASARVPEDRLATG